MQFTFKFIFDSFQFLLFSDFYIFPLVLFSVIFLINIVKRVRL